MSSFEPHWRREERNQLEINIFGCCSVRLTSFVTAARTRDDGDDKGPKWKFVGDKKSLVTTETLRENASITIHITGRTRSAIRTSHSDGGEAVS